jgi:ATP-binding cassette, subfamily B, bacterial PglK
VSQEPETKVATKVSHSFINLIGRMWKHLSQRRKRQFKSLTMLMVVSSFAEMISIGAVLPFLGVLTAPSQVFAYPMMQPIIEFFGYEQPNQLMLPITITFIIATVIAGATRVTLLYVNTRLSFAAGADISFNIYRRMLYQSYAVHTSHNSSELINGIITKTGRVIYGMFIPLLSLISSIVLLSTILITLIVINPTLALSTIVGFGGIYGVIILATRLRLAKNSQLIANNSTQVVKSLQESLGGIRDILIDGNQEFYCRIYRNADLPLRRAEGDNHIISNSPRFLIEALSMIGIAIVAYSMSQGTDAFTVAIPVLGALAISAQRLLPILQQGYSSISTMKASKSSIIDTLLFLDNKLPDLIHNSVDNPLPFEKKINLHNLSFRYSSDAAWVLKDIDFTIAKGSRIGFIGETGSGKSTLLDIIMGLLEPNEGELIIDGVPMTEANIRSWQTHIAHVPQNIYLADTTLYENIAFGIPPHKIDKDRVKKTASQAHISEVIESWPKKYETHVGERGVRLSGGQRQRIGIARALYKKADVIILDEATSALDNETEQDVMAAINDLSDELTILIIAHRLTTLKDCDQIVEIGKCGELKKRSYKQLLNL